MAISCSLYLSKDAFDLPSKETKADEKKAPDYKSLYGDTPLFKKYIKKPTNAWKQDNEPAEHKKARHEFQKQFNTLLDKLEKWGSEHKCEFQTHIPGIISGFKARFFDPGWSGVHDAKWFEKYKANLETIWFHTQKPEFNEIEKMAIDFGLRDAFDGTGELPTCSPGSGSDVETLVVQLNNEVSLPRWLSRICNKVIDQHAADHIKENDIRGIFRNHVYTLFRNYARQEGWPCSYDTSGTNDPYVEDAKISAKDVTALSAKLQAKFIPKVIFDRIQNEFLQQLETIFKNKGGEWFIYNKRLLSQVEDVLKKLKFKFGAIDIFDLSEDGTTMHFNKFKFKQNVLKALREQGKLFKKSGWVTRTVMPMQTQCLYFDDGNVPPQLIYLENPNEGVDISFNTLVELSKIPFPLENSIKNVMLVSADEVLEKAFKDSNFKQVMDVLHAGYPLTKKDQDGTTFITRLALHDAWDEVNTVLDRYSEQKCSEDIQLDGALFCAIWSEQWRLVDRLMKYPINLNRTFQADGPYAGFSSLHFAIYHNNTALAQSLIDKGAKLNVQADLKGTTSGINPTPLMIAAGNSRVTIETFDWLLNKDEIDLSCQNDLGNNALCYAASNGHTEKVRKIILKHREKKNLNKLDDPLCFAVWNGHVKTAEELIFAGASIKTISQTTVDEVITHGPRWDMFHFLIQHGYDLKPVLAKHLKNNHVVVAHLLLEHYEPVEMKRSSTLSELHPLCIVCQKEVTLHTFKWLLNHPKLQSELNKDSRCYHTMIAKLVQHNEIDKLNYLFELDDVQFFLAISFQHDFDFPNEAGKRVKEICKRNVQIKNIVTQLQINKLKSGIEPSVLAHEKLVNLFLNKMNLSEEDNKRLRFIVTQYNNKEEKIDYKAEPNLEWYSQAFMLAHASKDEKDYETRQEKIRDRAFNHFKQYLETIPPEERKNRIERAKQAPIFNKPTRRYFDFFGSPLVLKSLDAISIKGADFYYRQL